MQNFALPPDLRSSNSGWALGGGQGILLHRSLRTSLDNYWIVLDPSDHLNLKK